MVNKLIIKVKKKLVFGELTCLNPRVSPDAFRCPLPLTCDSGSMDSISSLNPSPQAQ